MLCTPDWFDANRRGEFVLGRHYLFVREFNSVRLEEFVRRFCETCEGKTWREVGEKMSRLGHWEFEDYIS